MRINVFTKEPITCFKQFKVEVPRGNTARTTNGLQIDLLGAAKISYKYYIRKKSQIHVPQTIQYGHPLFIGKGIEPAGQISPGI